MIVICEECGKKYRIDPSKIKGKAASFKCRVCTNVIMVTKSELESASQPPAAVPSPPTDTQADKSVPPPPESAAEPKGPAYDTVLTGEPRKRGLFGLRAKMLLLFLFIP